MEQQPTYSHKNNSWHKVIEQKLVDAIQKAEQRVCEIEARLDDLSNLIEGFVRKAVATNNCVKRGTRKSCISLKMHGPNSNIPVLNIGSDICKQLGWGRKDSIHYGLYDDFAVLSLAKNGQNLNHTLQLALVDSSGICFKLTFDGRIWPYSFDGIRELEYKVQDSPIGKQLFVKLPRYL